MKKNQPSKNLKSNQPVKRENKSAGVMRFFYILLLLLTVLSVVLRVSGGRRLSTANAGSETSARVLVFHHEEGSSCEDLVVTAGGDMIYSICGKGTENQYSLDDAEKTQLQNWLASYSAINYDHTDPAQSGASMTRLYLNGRGSQMATEIEIRQLIDFAESLLPKVVSHQ